MTILSVTTVYPLPLLGTNESNSSKNSIVGFEAFALSNNSLTFYSLAPMYLFNNSGPFTLIKFMLNLLAIAAARYVLPHPGGPYNKSP